ncbi:MAG TPA: BON domain-containing protein [Solirubrobacteraceae bacterium]|nr:BON domain-containing protein [Solirubrobacteraceae bacterium]
MTDQDLINSVTEELFWDPKVDNAAIAVSADDGKITLRGTVGSFREKQEAKKDAARVYGVKSVNNELEVRLLDEHRREDADLRGDVLQAFALDYLIPASVDAKVRDGLVTLKGSVDWQYQREEADFVAANVIGVIDVLDEITLKAKPKAKAVKDDIRSAFERNAALDADGLSVTTSNGTVKIKGAVNSWAEHDEAVSAAWAAPGVTDVDDRILVEY